MQLFWMCRVKGPRDGTWFAHYSLAEAKKEAERLAQLPDDMGIVRRVYLLECIGECEIKLSPVAWEYPDKVENLKKIIIK